MDKQISLLAKSPNVNEFNKEIIFFKVSIILNLKKKINLYNNYKNKCLGLESVKRSKK